MGGETRAENVAARRDGARLPLPVGPDFALDKAIKHVVTAAAKTKHYRAEHAAAHRVLAGRPARGR